MSALVSALLRLLAAQTPCEDHGPWPCAEAGCPAPSISCATLRANCDSTFDQVCSDKDVSKMLKEFGDQKSNGTTTLDFKQWVNFSYDFHGSFEVIDHRTGEVLEQV